MRKDSKKSGGGSSHSKPQAAIHTPVTFHPLRHITTSSIRSCNQNTGPTFSIKRLKLTVVIGIESGSRDDKSGTDGCVFLRRLRDSWPSESGADGEVGRLERRSCGKRLTAAFVGDVTCVIDSRRTCPPRPTEGEEADVSGNEVVTFGARRIDADGDRVDFEGSERMRVAAGGVEMKSRVCISD